jgi:hypothetical protein
MTMYGDKVDWDAHRKAVADLKLIRASEALLNYVRYTHGANPLAWSMWCDLPEVKAARERNATPEAIYKAVERSREFYI